MVPSILGEMRPCSRCDPKAFEDWYRTRPAPPQPAKRKPVSGEST